MLPNIISNVDLIYKKMTDQSRTATASQNKLENRERVEVLE